MNEDRKMSILRILSSAVLDYERRTGFDAINYRQLRKNASIKRRIEAAKSDLNWWRMYALEVEQGFDREIGTAQLTSEDL